MNTENFRQEEQQHMRAYWSDLKPTKLLQAMLQVQQEIPVVRETSKNPHFKNNYAPYDDIIKTIYRVMGKHGLMWAHEPEGYAIRTYIKHAASGEFVSGVLPLSNTTDPQKMGSNISYVKRYSLVCMLGLATGEDDDGHAASGRNGKPNGAATMANGKNNGAHKTEYISADQVKQLNEMCHNKPHLLGELIQQCGIGQLDKMPAHWFNRSKQWLMKKLQEEA